MKIIVLMEDTAGQAGIAAEHGLSLYIETTSHTILADTGASDATWENAKRLSVDLSRADIVALSHGHYDHAGGILSLAKYNASAAIYMRKSALGDYYHGDRYIGVDKRIRELPRICYTGDLCQVDEEISFFSNIRGRKKWPAGNLALSEYRDGTMVPDSFVHEQCLVIHEKGNYTLVSGCAHTGILNILERFEEIYHCEPDLVISGFHMMKKTPYPEEEIRDIQETAKILSGMHTMFYTGHCTGQEAFDRMKIIMKEKLQILHSGDCIL